MARRNYTIIDLSINAVDNHTVWTKGIEENQSHTARYRKTGEAILEKIKDLAALSNGTSLVINDNDGADDSNGEMQLLHLKKVFHGY